MVVSFDSQNAVRNAIGTALASDSTIQGSVGNPARVYDAKAEQDAPYPYIVLGTTMGEADDTKTEEGFMQTIDINFLSRSSYRLELNNMMDRASQLLHEASLSVSGHSLIFIRFQTSMTFVEDDGVTLHGVQVYEVRTSPA